LSELGSAFIKISVLTAFPDLIRSCVSSSVIGRGVESGRLAISIVDIRNHAKGGYRQIDDYSYGGGGMVLMPEPLESALDSIAEKGRRFVVCPSPQGVPLHQELVEDMYRIACSKYLVIVCGHYEGIDERFTERCVDLEFSLGDFVMTGGELPAAALIDSVSRLQRGVVGKEKSVEEDSFFSGMLDHPHYTRPASFRGSSVPEVLLSGDHKAIESFRRDEAVKRTIARRPDIIARAGIMPYLKHGVYVVQLHYPVLDKHGVKSATAITGVDLHDISRICRTYGVRKYLISTPLEPQQKMIRQIADHWLVGYGAEFNPDRREAMSLIKTSSSLDKALEWIKDREKAPPFTIATTAKLRDDAVHWTNLKRQILEIDAPAVFIFGTGSGLHEEILSGASAVMRPISGGSDDYNHLSVRSAIGIVLDRFFGFR
jgi:tRNA (guanine37-N1)-methyltransferase